MATMPKDIQFLIEQVKKSDCIFFRNGSAFTAKEAANHLTLKYNNGKRYAKNGNDFINNIASKSSWTGINYKIKCSNSDEITTNKWLFNQLKYYNKSLDHPK
ncbi:DUF5329 family protein [Pseudoalteromonas sp. G4]|uniref:DUF5329 family protein n=1 Tax=Pseudoalteromonas sp. G4 TaxID=2992761 RepID=UPI00237D38E4|nr:DUF5329 family protein [Pseudoalteromonas sp. G4]MDE3271024.1 DUF5329 domain-containing protein [Pseudoalteromonas sp. G4]